MKKAALSFFIPALAGIVVIGFLYGVFAFGHWDVNPNRWDSFARGAFAFLMIWAGVFTFLIVKEDLKD
jgi:hypothetical protein